MNRSIKYYLSPENNTVLKLTGADSLDLMHRISTNDLRGLKDGTFIETIFTTEKGRIVDLVQVCMLNGDFFITGHPGKAQALQNWLRKFIIADDVSVEILNNYRIAEIFTQSGNQDFEQDNNIIHPHHDKKSFLFSPGKGRMRLVYHADDQTAASDYLLGKGYNQASESMFVKFRVENMIPWSAELGEEFNPHEVGIIDRVNFRKGCYIGQEVIARIETYGKVQKVIKKVTVSEPVNSDLPLKLIDHENKDAGFLTSWVLNESNNSYVGLGVIRKAYLEQGTKLSAADGSNLIIEVR